MKHVDDEFWQAFAPDVLAHARGAGQVRVPDVRRGVRHHEALHVALHDARPASRRCSTSRSRPRRSGSPPPPARRTRCATSSWATTGTRTRDSNAYQLPTFLGNHDMGRIGLFIRQANSGATDDEVFARDRLAHELMYFSRGNPVIYYGDEQGFVGDGGDQDARQDMFPSQVATVQRRRPDRHRRDDGGRRTSTRTHPLYAAIGRAGERDAGAPGAAQRRPAAPARRPPAPACTRSRASTGASEHEYVVALNNSEQPQDRASSRRPPAAARAFERVYGDGAPRRARPTPAGGCP